MLERLEISDYRSCIDTEIDFQPDLSVLIGPNGSGKTNILKAILLLRSLSSANDYLIPDAISGADESRLKAVFRYDDKKTILTANVHTQTDENNDDTIVHAKGSWYAKDFTGSSHRINFPLGAVPRLIHNDQGDLFYEYGTTRRSRGFVELRDRIPRSFIGPAIKIWEFLRQIKYYGASQFTNPSRCPVSFEIQKDGRRPKVPRLRDDGNSHYRFLYDLYRSQGSESYEQFFSVIGPDGIGLIDKIEFKEIPFSVDDITVRSGGKVQERQREKIIVVPQFVVGRNELSPSQLSEGTFKTVTLLFYLMTTQSSALLIEEPEVCVHHGLLSSIVDLIKKYSRRKQIIISTHSDFVLDQVEPRNVYKVSRPLNSGTIAKQIAKVMSSRELTALRNYLDTAGNLGEYWRDGGLDEIS